MCSTGFPDFQLVFRGRSSYVFMHHWAEQNPKPDGIPQCREEWKKSIVKMPIFEQFYSF